MQKSVTSIFGGDDYDLGNNAGIDELESERQTVMALYVDSSYSMEPYTPVMPDCIQEVKNAIIHSKSEDEFLISLTKFNHKVERAGYQMVDKIKTDYTPSGGTALYDAIVGAQQSLVARANEKEGYIDMLKKNAITVKGIFIILTDGRDEHSYLGSKEAKSAVEYMKSHEIITACIGFGANAQKIGQELGFEHVLDVKEANEKTLRQIFAIVSKSLILASKSAVNPSAGTLFQV